MLRIATRIAPLLIAAAFMAGAATARAETASVGAKAPDFTLKTVDGKTVSLHDYKGKTVVLEWFNPDCPFVKFAHGKDGPLASQPKRVTDGGTVWLAINSSADGKQGSGLERNQKAAKEYSMSYPILLDIDGKVGKQYGAKTTPHMYVIDKDGNLRYNGALDNAPLGKPDGGTTTNFIDAAIKGVSGGRVDKAQTEAYGCSVKYES